MLVRSRDGRDHGRGRAIAALVIAVVWFVLLGLAVVLGVIQGFTADPERDDDGQVTSAGEQSILKLRTGDCFDYPELFEDESGEAAESAMVRGVPCSDAHQFEAYHEFDLPGSEFPGVEEVQELAAERCFREFRGFVGVPYGKSVLESYFLHPTATSWRLLDDRSVLCLVSEPGRLTAGTLAGSRR